MTCVNIFHYTTRGGSRGSLKWYGLCG